MDDYVDVKAPCGKVYVLQLEFGKYYIGYTERQKDERFLEHFHNNGSKWTKKYKPLDVLKIIPGTLQDEDEITLQYMKKYGWWNVRGGKWCEVNMEQAPAELTEPSWINSMYSFGQGVVSLIDALVSDNNKNKQGRCFRCGRSSHWANNCYAKRHADGSMLK